MVCSIRSRRVAVKPSLPSQGCLRFFTVNSISTTTLSSVPPLVLLVSSFKLKFSMWMKGV